MMNSEQQKQVSGQIEAYEQKFKVGKIEIPLGDKKFELEIDEFVANPEIMNSGVQVVEYLAQKPELIKGKTVTDMGTGSGIIGVAAGLLEARKVFMPDIDERAVRNATKNIQNLRLQGICDAFQSDLFQNFDNKEKSEVQIFNHPFFAEQPVKGKDWTRMMLGGTDLIAKYFEQAPRYSSKDATFILPWLTLANNPNTLDNDPGKRAQEYGYEILDVTEQVPVKQGLQRALFKIYKLKFGR
ncbi:MAG: 50S ribosomal protein L11 methyltransferase [Patescibacteria group bacterium]